MDPGVPHDDDTQLEYSADDFSFLDNSDLSGLFPSQLPTSHLWNLEQYCAIMTDATELSSPRDARRLDGPGVVTPAEDQLGSTNVAPETTPSNIWGVELNLDKNKFPMLGALFEFGSSGTDHANQTNALGLDINAEGQGGYPLPGPGMVSEGVSDLRAGSEATTTEPPGGDGTFWDWVQDSRGTLRRHRVKICNLCGTKVDLGSGTRLTSFINHRGNGPCKKAAKARYTIRAQSVPSSTSTSPPSRVPSASCSPLELPPIVGAEDLSPQLSQSAFPSAPGQSLCPGACMRFRASVYSTYLWQIHDYHQLPYTIISIGSDCLSLNIRSIECARVTDPSMETCCSCVHLDGNKELLAVIERTLQEPNSRSNYRYLNFTQLTSLLETKNTIINNMKLQSLNSTRKIASLVNTVDEHSLFVSAIASNDVPALSQLIRVAIKQQASVSEIIRRIKDAGESLYHVKSFSNREYDIAALALRTGGPRLERALKIAIGLPGLSTTYSKAECPQIRLSIYAPNVLDISSNILSLFRPIQESQPVASLGHVPPIRLWSILIDEVAIECRPRYDASSDSIAGICRDHSNQVDLMAVSSCGLPGIRAVQAALEAGKCHRAKEATVIAIAGFGEDSYTYNARIVAASPTCKAETEDDGLAVIVSTLEGWKSSPHGEILHGPISSLWTDGDPKRRRIFHQYCIREKLLPSSPLYSALGSLPLFNTFCGPGEITHGGDFKHEEKQFASALRSKDGILVAGTLINSGQLKLMLSALPDESPASVAQLFDVADHQNVPKANRLLSLVYIASQLPHVVLAPEHKSLVILGELLNSFTQPYTNPTLSLSQQLIHLSTCAHLLFALYCLNTGSFISGQLYYDVQTTIKTAYFTVAKSQQIDPNGPVYLLQGGTDWLEQRFSTMRTMTHDRNMDIVLLIDRVEAAQYIDEIYARNPDLYQGSYRLSLDGNTGIDHTNPASWTGDVTASSAGIRSCWSMGRDRAAQILTRGNALFCFDEAELWQQIAASSHPDNEIDIMQPLGSYVGINTDTIDPLDSSVSNNVDILESIEAEPVNQIPALSDEDLGIEDLLPPPHTAISEGLESIDTMAKGKKGWIDVDGKLVHAESLIRCCLGLDQGAKSNDRLRRVIGLSRSPYKPSLTGNRILGTDFILGQLVLSFIRIGSTPAAAIIKVTSIIQSDGTSTESLPHAAFKESTVKLSGQVLSLTKDLESSSWVWNQSHQWEVLPNTSKTNPSRSANTDSGSLSISKTTSIVQFPASLAIPINPAAHTQPSGIWAFEDEPLKELVASHWATIASSDVQNHIPVRTGTNGFPYRDENGQECFLQAEGQSLSIEANPNAPWPCYLCGKPIYPKDMRKHVATHLLARKLGVSDPKVMFPSMMSDFSCGFCGVQNSCSIEWRKPQRTYVPFSTCIYYRKFSLVSAETSTDANPSTNRPILCEICDSQTSSRQPSNAHIYWSYSMEAHIGIAHPGVTEISPSFRQKFTIEFEERERLGVNGSAIAPTKRIQPRSSKSNLKGAASSSGNAAIPAPTQEGYDAPGPSTNTSTETTRSTRATKRARATTNTMETQPGTTNTGSSKRGRATRNNK